VKQKGFERLALSLIARSVRRHRALLAVLLPHHTGLRRLPASDSGRPACCQTVPLRVNAHRLEATTSDYRNHASTRSISGNIPYCFSIDS